MEKLFKYLDLEEIENPNALDRLLHILTMVLLCILGLISLIVLLIFFMSGLWLVDLIYWIITGKSVVIGHL